MEKILLLLALIVVALAILYFILKPLYKLLKKSDSAKGSMPVLTTFIVFLAITYITFYYKLFKKAPVLEFITTMEKLLQIILIFLALIIFIYMLIGFFGKRYTLRVDKFNIGGINILFDQSSEIFIKTVGSFIGAKRTLFKFDKTRDNLNDTFDAYYASYKLIRDNLELLDPIKDEELYLTSVSILKTLNNFLTNHQTDFRSWYKHITTEDKIIIDEHTTIVVHSTTIEDVQKHYYRYTELISDIQNLNRFMNDIRIKETFKINRFDWEE